MAFECRQFGRLMLRDGFGAPIACEQLKKRSKYSERPGQMQRERLAKSSCLRFEQIIGGDADEKGKRRPASA